jgi:hypothetical protein
LSYGVHVKKHDGLIHNLLYTNVGFTVQTTDGEMIAARGGVGWRGKCLVRCGRLLAIGGNAVRRKGRLFYYCTHIENIRYFE